MKEFTIEETSDIAKRAEHFSRKCAREHESEMAQAMLALDIAALRVEVILRTRELERPKGHPPFEGKRGHLWIFVPSKNPGNPDRKLLSLGRGSVGIDVSC